MKKYLNKVRRLIKKFSEAHFVQVPREENMEADTLAKEASVSELTDEFDEVQYMPSIDLPEVQQIGGRRKLDDPNNRLSKGRKASTRKR